MSDAPSPSLHQFDALRQANLARAKEWNPTGADTGPGFAGLELAGEVGELCNLLKKAERARLGLVGGSVSPAAIAEELADVVICADLVGLALGLDLWPIVVRKFNATSRAKGFATRLNYDGYTATEASQRLAEQQVEALIALVHAYQDAADNAPTDGQHDLESLRKEESIMVRGRNAKERCLSLGIDLDRRIPVSVARFKDAGHPATAAGEAAEPTPEQIGERLADIKNADFRSAALTRAMVDQLSTLLGKGLRCLSKQTLYNWITQLENDLFGEGADTEERIQANAMLVGILTVMLSHIDTANVERGGD